jgi:hypothetical protein
MRSAVHLINGDETEHSATNRMLKDSNIKIVGLKCWHVRVLNNSFCGNENLLSPECY